MLLLVIAVCYHFLTPRSTTLWRAMSLTRSNQRMNNHQLRDLTAAFTIDWPYLNRLFPLNPLDATTQQELYSNHMAAKHDYHQSTINHYQPPWTIIIQLLPKVIQPIKTVYPQSLTIINEPLTMNNHDLQWFIIINRYWLLLLLQPLVAIVECSWFLSINTNHCCWLSSLVLLLIDHWLAIGWPLINHVFTLTVI